MKSGDSRFPEALGWMDLCYVNKAVCASCLVRESKLAILNFCSETKHGSQRRTREEQGAVQAGVAEEEEEEPFPSQLRLLFLWEEEVPSWARSDLILSCKDLPLGRVAAL